MNDEESCLSTGCPAASSGKCCQNNGCRYWIDYPEDLNCVFTAVEKHGPMTLEETAKRLGLSLVRISQIEKNTLNRLSKKIKR